MTEIVLMSDPRIAAVSIVESAELLVDLRRIPELRIDSRLADADGAYAHVRKGLAERLMAAQRAVRPRLRLLLVEGYRPIALQTRYHNSYAARLRPRYADGSTENLVPRACGALTPPEVAPHVCGAAIDLTLCTVDGAELPMGTEVNADPEDSDGACYTAAANITAEAAANRRTLRAALTGAGLVNYPTKWWHWSYGDRYWAYLTGAPHARYGPLD